MNYYNLEKTGGEVKALLNAVAELQASAVKFTSQVLSDDDKVQARTNIGAVGQSDIENAVATEALSPKIQSVIAANTGTQDGNLATVSYVKSAQASYPQFVYAATTAVATAHNSIYVVPGDNNVNELWVNTTNSGLQKVSIGQNQNVFFNSFGNAQYYDNNFFPSALNLDWNYYSITEDSGVYYFVPIIPAVESHTGSDWINITSNVNPWNPGASWSSSYTSQNWQLNADLDIDLYDYNSVINFFNTFDGLGHTLTLTYATPSESMDFYQGLFYNGIASTKTLTIKNVFIKLKGYSSCKYVRNINTLTSIIVGVGRSDYSINFENVHLIVDGNQDVSFEMNSNNQGYGQFGLFVSRAKELSFKNCSILNNLDGGNFIIDVPFPNTGYAPIIGGFVGLANNISFDNCISTIKINASYNTAIPVPKAFGGFIGSGISNQSVKHIYNKVFYYNPNLLINFNNQFFQIERPNKNQFINTMYIIKDCYYTNSSIGVFRPITELSQYASPQIIPQYIGQLAINTNNEAQRPLWLSTGSNIVDWVPINT